MAHPKLANLGTRLFRAKIRVGVVRGISVSIHWSWCIALVSLTLWGSEIYSSWVWMLGECGVLFSLVLLHEFGHVVAARRAGLRSNAVILWAMGGLAMFDSPKGWKTASLIAVAGPAVNAMLVPVTYLVWYGFGYRAGSDLHNFFWRISGDNLLLLLFNLLPIWPLDGGRFLESVLRGRYGMARSQLICGVIGLIFTSGVSAWFLRDRNFIGAGLCTILICSSIMPLQISLAISATIKESGFHEFAICPHCRNRAIDGPLTTCGECFSHCHPFTHGGVCWNCKSSLDAMPCHHCGEFSEVAAWLGKVPDREPD